MAKKNGNPFLGFLWTLILSGVTFLFGICEQKPLFILAAVVLIVACSCKEQKSNVVQLMSRTNEKSLIDLTLDSCSRI